MPLEASMVDLSKRKPIKLNILKLTTDMRRMSKVNKLRPQALTSPNKQEPTRAEPTEDGPVGAAAFDFFSLLTESKKNEIKRMIGSALLNILKQVTIRIILRKQLYQRTEEDVQRLVRLLKSQVVFKKFHKMGEDDYRELTKYITYHEVVRGEAVITEGEKVQSFYVVLRGRANAHQRNPQIHRWAWAKKAHEALLEWKSKEFDVRVEHEMKLQVQKVKNKVDPEELERRFGSIEGFKNPP